LAPVIIPQNTNPIPTAITSPMGENGDVMSPGSAGGFVRRAAPEPNKRALYVGGLDPRVTEDVLRQIFETTGHVQNVKIIPDKNVGAVSIFPLLCQILQIFIPLQSLAQILFANHVGEVSLHSFQIGHSLLVIHYFAALAT
jgi:nucleolysin TIA-1/TIAR